MPAVTGPATGGTPKALALLEDLARSGEPARLTDLADRCAISKPSAHRILTVLRELGWVGSAERGRYCLGPRAHAFAAGAGAASSTEAVLGGLRDEVGHTVHAGVLASDRVVYTHKLDGRDPFAMRSRVGGSMPLHCTGIGKALLAHLPAARRDAVIAAGLPRRTPNTITDPAALRRELAAIRERGYAVDDEENEVNVRCVAAVVPDREAFPRTSLSIATVTFLTTREQLLGYVTPLHAAAHALADAADRAGFVSPERTNA